MRQLVRGAGTLDLSICCGGTLKLAKRHTVLSLVDKVCPTTGCRRDHYAQKTDNVAC